MKTRSRNISPHALTAGIVLLALFLAGAIAVPAQTPAASSSDSTSVPEVKCVIGVSGVKPGASGTITVKGDAVSFESGKKKGEIKVNQIQDIYLGNESRQDITGLGGTAMKAAIPYGGGRILSLFSHKVEVMTIEFIDDNGGAHGAIFVLPPGHATALKSLLVSKGAKVNQHAEPPPPPAEDKQ